MILHDIIQDRLLKHDIIYIQLAKMSFDEIFDLTAGVYFIFYNICTDCLTSPC